MNEDYDIIYFRTLIGIVGFGVGDIALYVLGVLGCVLGVSFLNTLSL